MKLSCQHNVISQFKLQGNNSYSPSAQANSNPEDQVFPKLNDVRMCTSSAALDSQNQMILLRCKVGLQVIKRKPLTFRYHFFDSSMAPEKNKLDLSPITTESLLLLL